MIYFCGRVSHAIARSSSRDFISNRSDLIALRQWRTAVDQSESLGKPCNEQWDRDGPKYLQRTAA